MRKITIIMIALIIMGMGVISGCNESLPDLNLDDDSDKEVVVVTVYTTVYLKNFSNPDYQGPELNNVEIRYDIDKVGGESFTYYRNTDINGKVFFPVVSYNLHHDENIGVTVYHSGSGTRGDVLNFYDAKEGARSTGNNSWATQWEPTFTLYI